MSATESAISRLFTQFGSANNDLIYTDPITGLENFNYNRQFSMDHITHIRAEGQDGVPVFGGGCVLVDWHVCDGSFFIRICAPEVRDPRLFRRRFEPESVMK